MMGCKAQQDRTACVLGIRIRSRLIAPRRHSGASLSTRRHSGASLSTRLRRPATFVRLYRKRQRYACAKNPLILHTPPSNAAEDATPSSRLHDDDDNALFYSPPRSRLAHLDAETKRPHRTSTHSIETRHDAIFRSGFIRARHSRCDSLPHRGPGRS